MRQPKAYVGRSDQAQRAASSGWPRSEGSDPVIEMLDGGVVSRQRIAPRQRAPIGTLLRAHAVAQHPEPIPPSPPPGVPPGPDEVPPDPPAEQPPEITPPPEVPPRPPLEIPETPS